MPVDVNGDPIPAAGSNSEDVVDWITDELMPRLALVRSDLAVITDGNFETYLTAQETGLGRVFVDRGDVLALDATTGAITGPSWIRTSCRS